MNTNQQGPVVAFGKIDVPPGPWEVYPHAQERNLWMVKTSMGLVIGPIYGREVAIAIAATPDLLAAAEGILSKFGHRSDTQLTLGERRVLIETRLAVNAARGRQDGTRSATKAPA